MNKYLNDRGFSPIILIILVLIVIGGVALILPKLKNNPITPTLPHPKRIGIVQHTKGLDNVYQGFKEGLTSLGYKEGSDVIYTYNFTGGDPTTASKIARDYLDQNYDLILAITTVAFQKTLEESTRSGKMTPIIFTNSNTALTQGLIKSYQSSGNNSTGLIPDDVAISIKKLEFLKQINPNAKRVGVFTSKRVPATIDTLNKLEAAAPKAGLTIKEYVLGSDVPAGPQVAIKMQQIADKVQSGEIDAVMTLPDPLITDPAISKVLESMGERLKIPTMFLNLQDGGMLAYNLDTEASGKDAAVMADKIFKGTKPADIPIEFPKKNLLIINLEIANKIGVTIPPSLLNIADKIIK